MTTSLRDLARLIDHTNLRPHATEPDILRLCSEAREHQFAAVCVNPVWVTTAAKALIKSGVRVCAVVGFPTGAHTTANKLEEAKQCLRDGAVEIDMVANHAWLIQGRDVDYRREIEAVRAILGSDTILKVIIEASLLTWDQVDRAADLVASAGANYVKTSTGVYGQARIENVQLLRRVLPPYMKIKAAGGIRTAKDALAMREAGADRIGTSASVSIITTS